MNTGQIDLVLHALVPGYCNTYSADMIPETKRPCYFVVNTHPSRKRGEHWVAIILLPSRGAEFFDSFGMLPRNTIAKYLNKQGVWVRNASSLQDPLSRTCGLFCCVYIYQRSKGFSFKQFLDQFGSNKERNETIIKHLFNEMLEKSKSVVIQTCFASLTRRPRSV